MDIRPVIKRFSVFVLMVCFIFVFGTAAQAALQSFAPPGQVATLNGVSIGGIPAWYQDINGVSVQPCLVPATCGLIGLGDPMFNEALPLSYPTNFPTEAFYSDAVAIFPAGTASALVVMGMEYTFVDAVTGALIGAPPRPANALGAPFQRQRIVLSYPPGVAVPTAGTFTLTHPWGVTTFPFGSAKCVNNAGGTKCSMTRDLPIVGTLPPSFAAALGTGIAGSQSTFLRDPLAPAGFLGSATAVAAFTGAVAGSANSISVTDPLGNIGTTTSLTLLVGQLVGLTAAPATVTFPAQAPGVTSLATTVTITNPSAVNPATITAAAVTGANVADFILVPGAPDCLAGANLAAGASCNFGVKFLEPAPGVNGTKSALITFPVTTPLSMPPVLINLAGAIDNIPPTVVTTLPADGATNWPANNRPHVTFSEPVTGVSNTTFTIIGPTGDVGGTVTPDPTGKLYDYAQPAGQFVSGATYTATLSSVITDIAGNPLATTTFSFKAGAADTTPPTVSATTPGDNATDVSVNSPITVTFLGSVDPNTVNETTFTLSEGVTGSVTFDPANRTAIFKPASPLAFFHSYTATVKGGAAGVKSLGQVPMVADKTWTFFTNGAPNPPQLYSPADGAKLPGTSVDLQWIKAKDADGEDVTYHVWYCTNPGFVGCNPVDAPASPSLHDTLAGLGGYGAGMLLAGIAIAGGVRSRKKLFFFIAILLISGMAVTACGKKSDDNPGIDPATISTKTITGLHAGTYYWKVVADDGNGAQIASETRSFSMQ
jgi:Big-like domain-containing protein